MAAAVPEAQPPPIPPATPPSRHLVCAARGERDGNQNRSRLGDSLRQHLPIVQRDLRVLASQSSANSDRWSALNPGIAASASTIFAVRYPRTLPDIAAIASRDLPRL